MVSTLFVLSSQFLILFLSLAELFFEVLQLAGEFKYFSIFFKCLLVLKFQSFLSFLMLGFELFKLMLYLMVVFFVFRKGITFFEESFEGSWSISLVFLEGLSFDVDAHAFVLNQQALYLLFEALIGLLLLGKLCMQVFVIFGNDEYLLSLLY